MNPFPKSCGCGREHDAEAWAALTPVGHQGGRDADGWWCVEMKNCPCGTTLAIDCSTPPRRLTHNDWSEVANADP